MCIRDSLIDAYCGVGTIGLAFANKVKSIRGMDIIPEAIEDARKDVYKRQGTTSCESVTAS